MEITEVRITPVPAAEGSTPSDGLIAGVSLTLDRCFAVHDVKIILKNNNLFLSMPSKRLQYPCPSCGSKNVTAAYYCNWCGAKLTPRRPVPDALGRTRLYSDLAHPTTAECRKSFETVILGEYRRYTAGQPVKGADGRPLPPSGGSS